jgi:FAD/FMN-containing dehydrogenase/Fe-S oxidoreductase
MTIVENSTERRRSGPAMRGPDADGARSLARELSSRLDGEVRFSPGSRALYANDSSVYRQVPTGVVIPRTVDDVLATVEVCRAHRTPIFARGCGTGLAGQTVNDGVVIDFSKYLNRIVEIDARRRFARVQPGIVLDRLREAAEEHALTFGPDPATHSRCTLGGMIGNNSCGTHSILAGVTADNIEELDVVLYDGTRLMLPSHVSDAELERTIAAGGRQGEIYAALRDLRDRYADEIRGRFPDIPRRISGYNLDRLLPERGFNLAAAMVGTESTCALILEARCTLIPSPQYRSLVLLGYADAPTSADRVPEIMEFQPIALETFDRRLVEHELSKGFKRHPELLPGGDAWLLVEFGGEDRDEADAKAERMLRTLREQGGEHLDAKLYEDPAEVKEVWAIREGGVGNSKVPGEHPGWPSWEDAAVPPERTGDYLRDLQRLCDKHGREISCFFGHVGHGCVHTRIDWDFLTPEGVRNYRAFMEDAGDLIASYGGSLSGEHGDGQARAELLPKMFGPVLVQAFREFKAIWDPAGAMNPGKLSDPYPLDTHLQIDPGYRTRRVRTHFRLPEDGGSFAAASERCFGVGACRDQEGTMCPSYQATMEEQHSTRGRARLLNEMLRTDSIEGGWRNQAVKESLDLCLACKGCKHECPVRVDMATYKAEFLSHYFKGRLRPRQAYALGLIPWEARIAARAPRLANFLLHQQPLAAIGKALAGVAPERHPPRFAPQTFTSWFGDRERPQREGGRRVVLWPDTFNNHFHPEVAIAATEVLEAAGCQVTVPQRSLCCGRPLYDYGMLTLAERQLRQILDTLRAEIQAGIPVIALEPSCGAVLRDELPGLLPHDEDAKRLRRQTVTLGEYLAGLEDWEAPRLERQALVHLHCHQKATSDTDCDTAVLSRLGVDYELIDSGCCGLAGSFGYERGEKYELSMKVGEQRLLPAVREAPEHALLITDGFSCRSQIEHATDRRPLHLAQVAQMALRSGPSGPAAGAPGDHVPPPPVAARGPRRRLALAAGLLAAAAATAGTRLARRGG